MNAARREIVSAAVLIALLLTGLGLIQALFLREHQEALARVQARLDLRDEQARRVLIELLGREQRERAARREAAVLDPLVAAEDLYLRRAGAVLLPRPVLFRSGEGRALSWQEAVLGTPLLFEVEDEPVLERLALAQTVHTSLGSKDRASIETAVRAFLMHRSRFSLAAEVDLPLTLATLGALHERAAPDPAWVRGLLAGRPSGEASVREAGLMGQLLRRRDRFTEAEFHALAAQVASLARSYGIPHDLFLARVQDRHVDPPPLDDLLEGPVVDSRMRWYLEPSEPDVVGFAFDQAEMLDRVREEMVARSMIGPSETVSAFGVGSDAHPSLVPADRLELRVSDLELRAEVPAAERRLATKTALVAGTTLLVFFVFGFGLAWQRRERALVELKQDFVSAVSHELRTPLASVRLLAETLERRLEGDSRSKDYPTRIVREIDGAAFLVENILSFQRIDKGRWQLSPERLDLAELFLRSAEDLSRQLGRSVRLEVFGGPALLNLDAELARLLASNLVKNAILYNEQSEVRIHLTVRKDRDHVVVLVRDNGIGVPSEEQKMIFDDFQRGSRAGRSRRPGSGLGLGLVRRVMSLHRGRVRLLSSDTTGTEFELEFPAGVDPNP